MRIAFKSGWGMGAQLSMALGMMKKAKLKKEPLTIELLGRYNGDDDWFSVYFRLLKPDPESDCTTYSDPAQLKLPSIKDMSFEEAHDLFHEYAEVRYPLYPMEYRALGLHYRCGDKWTESSYVPKSDFVKEAVNEIKSEEAAGRPYGAMFITDGSWPASETMHIDLANEINEQIGWPNSKRPALRVLSINKDPLMQAHSGGLEALQSMLAFSQCRKLLRTCSNLSAWACVFNPKLVTRTLNRPLADCMFWPETEIIRRESK